MADRSRPAEHAASITPHDTNALTMPTRALYVGGAGNMVVTMDGTDVTFNGIAAGTILPVVVTHVKSTSTTATNILALW